jgi:hypothetical protein
MQEQESETLQEFLDELSRLLGRYAGKLPELKRDALTGEERMRLFGAGTSRFGYMTKVSEIARQFPLFWPASADRQDRLDDRLRKIHVLRNLLIWLQTMTRTTEDLLLINGDQAYRAANLYYTSVRTMAQAHSPEAEQLFQMLEPYWKQSRKKSDKPTQEQLVHHAEGLLNGTREGELLMINEGDTVVKGKRVVVDKTRRKGREVRVEERVSEEE